MRITALATFRVIAPVTGLALALGAAPAGATTPRPDRLAGMMRAAQQVCQADLRGSACGGHQQRLLSAVAADAGGDGHAAGRAMAGREVAGRQLDALIASLR